MTCPKCGGSMKTFDRFGVHVEQCAGCKGIFLDYGELEQIVSAEQRHYEAPPPLEYDGPPAQQQAGYRPDSPRPYRGRPDSPGPIGGFGGHKDSRRRKKRSLFEELFD